MTAMTATTVRRAEPIAAPAWTPRPVKAAPAATPGKGRGLFAAQAIAAGELIDLACTVPLTPAQCKALDTMLPFGDFYFEHPVDRTAGLVVFGPHSLCNHSDAPNADVQFASDAALGWVAQLIALADIPAGAEITYRYRCPVWFERRD